MISDISPKRENLGFLNHAKKIVMITLYYYHYHNNIIILVIFMLLLFNKNIVDYFKDYFTDEKLGLKCCLRLIYINLFARDINNVNRCIFSLSPHLSLIIIIYFYRKHYILKGKSRIQRNLKSILSNSNTSVSSLNATNSLANWTNVSAKKHYVQQLKNL